MLTMSAGPPPRQESNMTDHNAAPTREEAMAAIAWLESTLDDNPALGRAEPATLLTLARAGAEWMFASEETVEKIAREMAVQHGGKVLYRKDGHAVTVRERFGYGVDSGWGHHLDEYASKHWRDYIDAARAALAALSQKTP